eukprot:jgi/Chlat1/1947/Chrsp157S02267
MAARRFGALEELDEYLTGLNPDYGQLYATALWDYGVRDVDQLAAGSVNDLVEAGVTKKLHACDVKNKAAAAASTSTSTSQPKGDRKSRKTNAVKGEAKVQKQAAKALERQVKEVEKEKQRVVKAAEHEAQRAAKEAHKQLKEQEKQHAREAAERKQQLELKQQASIMERFLKRSSKTPTTAGTSDRQPESAPAEPKFLPYILPVDTMLASPVSKKPTTTLIDKALAVVDDVDAAALLRWHHRRWHALTAEEQPKFTNGGWNIRRLQSWSQKQQSTGKVADVIMVDVDDEWDMAPSSSEQPTSSRCMHRRKLLQFSGSNRPAFYGTGTKTSSTVSGRHPFKQDHDLDYEFESDDEWEEEEPGESLADSDNEKDEEDATDDVDDGFVVEDGYLSEDERAAVLTNCDEDLVEAELNQDAVAEPATSGIADDDQLWSKRARTRERFATLADRVRRSNHQLVICNFQPRDGAEAPLPPKEQAFLEAFSMHVLAPSIVIQPPPLPNTATETHDEEGPAQKRKLKPIAEEWMTKLVAFLVGATKGVDRSVDDFVLQHPDCRISKQQLRWRVRDLCELADGRYQVKKDVIEAYSGQKTESRLSPSLQKARLSPSVQKPISSFFRNPSQPDKPSVTPIRPFPDLSALDDNMTTAIHSPLPCSSVTFSEHHLDCPAAPSVDGSTHSESDSPSLTSNMDSPPVVLCSHGSSMPGRGASNPNARTVAAAGVGKIPIQV